MAVVAAMATTLACYLRLSLWLNRSAPVWYLEAVIFFCSIVLWGFVFAWHTPYAGRPVWVFRLPPRLLTAATLTAIGVGTIFHLFIDPSIRSHVPEEFPVDFQHWSAFVLFSLFFNQLFVVFAPFAWLMRLFRHSRAAILLTVLFGVFVLALKAWHFSTPLPTPLFAALLAGRALTGFLSVIFYLRGGVLLVSWWTFLFECRHLLDLTGQAG